MTGPVIDAELLDRVRRRMVAGTVDVASALRAENAGIVDDTVFDRLRRDVHAELHGAGPLEPLLATPGVTDVLVNGPRSVWLDRGRGLERVGVTFPDEVAVRALAQRLAAGAGRRLDDAMPHVDAVLADGSRLHAVLPPLVPTTTLSLRVLGRRRHDLDSLVALAAMPADVAATLRDVVAARLAFVVTGGTGTGKTTLLGALLGTVDAGERLLLIEDAPELVVEHPHTVRLVTRPANVEGAGEVGLRELVRQALRMRPDRLVVGEFRGAEMVELLVALNTGHEGSAATMHANSAADVPARFAALGALAGFPAPAVTSLVASAVTVIVHLRRGRDGRRAVAEIALLDRVGDALAVVPAWSAAGGAGPGAGRLTAAIDDRAAR
ncbi:pilus assembly protein CpaF [Jatrophihabitans endophyticus]|uniref:Pilus assembly protein CpaF n=1 Tax=Jatrophihabitans endophyticus TaxID=1206085 RepID=A0A1M5H241_9ACTN|nr:TadA family conjugal transfer-associated ATPase [Jatrophihabitans endophyticus]SHG09995.1 pilus assembly protein CpaF [Jatrophihabitans endophyticus]